MFYTNIAKLREHKASDTYEQQASSVAELVVIHISMMQFADIIKILIAV